MRFYILTLSFVAVACAAADMQEVIQSISLQRSSEGEGWFVLADYSALSVHNSNGEARLRSGEAPAVPLLTSVSVKSDQALGDEANFVLSHVEGGGGAVKLSSASSSPLRVKLGFTTTTTRKEFVCESRHGEYWSSSSCSTSSTQLASRQRHSIRQAVHAQQQTMCDCVSAGEDSHVLVALRDVCLIRDVCGVCNGTVLDTSLCYSASAAAPPSGDASADGDGGDGNNHRAPGIAIGVVACGGVVGMIVLGIIHSRKVAADAKSDQMVKL